MSAHDPSGARLSRGSGAAIVAIVALGFAAGQVLGVLADVLARLITHDHRSITTLSTLANPPWWFIAASLVGLWAGFAGATVIASRTYGLLPRSAFAVRASDVLFVIVGLMLQAVVDVLYSVAHLYSNYKGNSTKIFSGATGHGFLILALMTCIGAPIFEELLFRGVLLDGVRAVVASARGSASLVASVTIDGVLFAAAHAEWEAFIGLAITGVVLAVIYARTKRIVPCILTHASFNALAVFAVLAAR